MHASLTKSRWREKQPVAPRLHHRPDTLRTEAAGVVVEMSPDRIPDCEVRTAWSRARGGDNTNPFYRCALFFRALRLMGGSYADAWIGLAWLIGKVDAMWADTAPCIRTAHEEEIEADADEDVFQYRVLVEPQTKAAYRARLVRQLAKGHALLAALDAEGAK